MPLMSSSTGVTSWRTAPTTRPKSLALGASPPADAKRNALAAFDQLNETDAKLAFAEAIHGGKIRWLFGIGRAITGLYALEKEYN